MAVVIAACIRDNPSLAGVQGALTVDSVRGALDRYLNFRVNDPRSRALSILSLLEHVGWSKDLQDESTRLSDARPHVRRWAEKVVESERKGIERARQEEAEERVTRGW